MKLRPLFSILIVPLIVLGGCRKQEPPPVTQQEELPTLARPSASLGMFVSHYLGGGILPLTSSAMTGLEAGLVLVAGFNPLESQDTFALLQEFGNILQVDIPDLLNRSTDRTTTLNAYVESLENITARCLRMREDLQQREDVLRVKEREARTAVSTLQKNIDRAFRDQDYSAAGALRQELSTAKLEQTKVGGENEEVRDLGRTYEELLEIADERLQAIGENREILISGLKVVEVPGVESLGILEEAQNRRRSGGSTIQDRTWML
ncbi:MAG: hypothetical protein WCV62_05030 [Candidatus Peribacteraceae bacterium]|jgi:hypothetical protein